MAPLWDFSLWSLAHTGIWGFLYKVSLGDSAGACVSVCRTVHFLLYTTRLALLRTVGSWSLPTSLQFWLPEFVISSLKKQWWQRHFQGAFHLTKIRSLLQQGQVHAFSRGAPVPSRSQAVLLLIDLLKYREWAWTTCATPKKSKI